MLWYINVQGFLLVNALRDLNEWRSLGWARSGIVMGIPSTDIYSLYVCNPSDIRDDHQGCVTKVSYKQHTRLLATLIILLTKEGHETQIEPLVVTIELVGLRLLPLHTCLNLTQLTLSCKQFLSLLIDLSLDLDFDFSKLFFLTSKLFLLETHRLVGQVFGVDWRILGTAQLLVIIKQ